MSKMHEYAVKNRLTRFLARRAKPRHLEDPAVAQDEIEALTRRIARHAPTDPADLTQWWERFEPRLEDSGNGRHWPTPAEVDRAARATPGAGARTPAPDASFGGHDWHLDVIANRIRGGLPISEHHLWGREATDLVKSGRVSERELNRGRSAFAAALAEIYGDDAAADKVSGLMAAHETFTSFGDKQREAQPVRKPSSATAARIISIAAERAARATKGAKSWQA